MTLPRQLHKVIRRIGTWLAPRRFERELDEELSFHLDMQTRWHESKGVDPAIARALAAREFGGETRFKEAVRDARGLSWAHDLGRDVQFALRSYRRTPGFTAVALLTLALGIGITTAAFSIVDAVLIRPLPYPEAGRIIDVTGRDSLGNDIPAVSAPNFYDWRDQSHSFEAMALYSTDRRGVASDRDAVYVETASVSADFFRVMRIPAAVGRTLAPADAQVEAPVAVVSHGFWQRALGGQATLPSEPLRIGNGRYVVVGVLPAGQEFPRGVDVFLPYPFGSPWRTASRNNINFQVIARLSPNVTLERARAEMRGITAAVHAAHPEDLYGYGVSLTPLQEKIVGPVRTYLALLSGAVAVVLLVVCANLVNANLARGAVRAREIAVRTALGAGRGRLVRQLLVESVVLGVAGGVAGVGVAWALVRLVGQASGVDLPRANEIGLDAGVLAFALALSIGVGLIIGLAPAFHVGRARLYETIATGGRSTATRGRAHSRDVLIGIELALAIVLLVGAGLLIRSFRAVISRDMGFPTGGAITAELSLPRATYGGRRAVRFYDDLFASLRTLPGVTAVGATTALPLGQSATGFIEVEGQTDQRAGAGYRVVSDDYFEAMGIGLLRGRGFTSADDSGTARVTIINRQMADKYWPGQDPIGRRFKAKSMEWKDPPWLTVVGVVANVRHWGLEAEPSVEHYVLYRQRSEFANAMAVVVRGGDPSQTMRAVRDRIRSIDRDVPVELGTLGGRVERSLGARRFIMNVLVAFGALALLLAAVGVYGVLSFTVAQRTREIAVRMALGAERRRVVGLVVGHVLRVSAVASVVGLVAARAASRLMSALLFEVSPADPRTYVVVTVILIGVAALAAYIPARRAARVDPMLALRAE
ncbi:MAG TPA: ABC transporter permease [Gemmatimonadaceae bacterium]|nr:ABC transporter permease [Gemmatimonadaceae bacterium]